MHRSRYRYQFDEHRSEHRLSEQWTSAPLTLEEARAANAFVILWGEYGGSTYLIAAAKDIRCTRDQLDDVLAMLDREGWGDFQHAGVRYAGRLEAAAAVKAHHARIGAGEVWISQALLHVADRALAAIAGVATPDGQARTARCDGGTGVE